MDRKELHFACSEDIYAEAKKYLSEKHNNIPERGFIGLVSRSNGELRTTYLLKEILPPSKSDVTFNSKGLIFSQDYKTRAIDKAAKHQGLGIIFVHTHPSLDNTSYPSPSSQDLKYDREDLFHIGQALTDGVPLLAGIMSDDGNWSIRTYKFNYASTPSEAREKFFQSRSGKYDYITAIRIVGDKLVKMRTNHFASGPRGAFGEIDDNQTSSGIEVWGKSGQQILSGLRVGIIGLGGVGGILSEHLPRLGVGEVVLIEYDIVRSRNLNRAQGASFLDVKHKTPKLEVAHRNSLRSATCPNFKVYTIEGSIVEDDTLPFALDCDIILNGADTDWARQVLDQLANSHLIHVIDGGTILRTTKDKRRLLAGQSDINVSGPSYPCFSCADIYTKEGVTKNQEPPSINFDDGYFNNDNQNRPSVLPNNALVAGLMQLRFQNIVLPNTPPIIGTQRYDVLYGDIKILERRNCNKKDCETKKMLANGYLEDLPTGIDLHYSKIKDELGVNKKSFRSNGWFATIIDKLRAFTSFVKSKISL